MILAENQIFDSFPEAIKRVLSMKDRQNEIFVGPAKAIDPFLISQLDDEELLELGDKIITIERKDLIILPVNVEKVCKLVVVRPNNQIHILQTTGEIVWGFPINELIFELKDIIIELGATQSNLNKVRYN